MLKTFMYFNIVVKKLISSVDWNRFIKLMKRHIQIYILILLVTLVFGCVKQQPLSNEITELKNNSQTESEVPTKSNSAKSNKIIKLKATYYGKGDGLAGKKTASGERLNPNKFTAAHKTYPFGTILKVTNPSNGKVVEVKVNDRGPFIKGCDLDLTYAAAKELGIIKKGTAVVEVEKLYGAPSSSSAVGQP